MSRIINGIAAAAVGGCVAYAVWARPRLLRWGVSADEVDAVLPGDDIVPSPRTTSTRGIGIDAGAEDVWPWLAQLGQGRGGLYSYDWLENLFGVDIRNVDEVVPELQHIAVGDRVILVPADDKDAVSLEVAVVEPNRALVLRAPGTAAESFAQGMGYPSWAFVIEPRGPGRVKLFARWRCEFAPSVSGYLMWKYGIEPVHFVMERRMLKGIKERAERLRQQRTVEPDASPTSPQADTAVPTDTRR